MEFREALHRSLKSDKHTHTDPFLLHSRVSDLVGDNYESAKAAEKFYRLDAKYEISKTIISAAPVKRQRRKKRYYKIKPVSPPPDNAYVFFTDDSPTLHVSRECPILKHAPSVYRATYDHARVTDFKYAYLSDRSCFYELWHAGSIARLSRRHKPHVCRRCGDFSPRITNGIFYRLATWIFEHTCIDIHRTTKIYPKKR